MGSALQLGAGLDPLVLQSMAGFSWVQTAPGRRLAVSISLT